MVPWSSFRITSSSWRFGNRDVGVLGLLTKAMAGYHHDARKLARAFVDRTTAMLHIDYGLGVMAADAFAMRPADEVFDLADFYRELARRRRLAGLELAERFYEIDSPEGLDATDAFLRQMNGKGS